MGAMAMSATSAGAAVFSQPFNNWVVSGSLTPKKLNEPVTLPKGSTFNGSAEVHYKRHLFEEPSGTVTGTVSVPPFTASLKLLGLVPTTVGVTFTQVGKGEGTITPDRGACGGTVKEEEFIPCVTLSVPTKVNVGITLVGVLGLSVPTHCETSEPIVFPLLAHMTLLELSIVGPQFSGEATIPSMTCEGPEGLVLGPVLSAVMSGPENPYVIEITRPGIKRPPA
jgi:hypothetical protein